MLYLVTFDHIKTLYCPNSHEAFHSKAFAKNQGVVILKHVSNARSPAFWQAEDKFDVFTSNAF